MYKDGDNWNKLDTNIKGRSITAKTNQGGVYAVFYDSEAPPPIPEKFELVSLYPNPFNPYLNIKYNLDIQENVSIVIYNLLGQEVRELLNKNMSPGYHSIQWDGQNEQGVLLGSGIYFVRISTNEKSYTGKVSLIK